MWSLMLTIVSLALLLAAQPQPTPQTLHVVVIAGEDAVNIIQQKTAVKPIVEVRDRNNLPVPGALVTFTIEGGKAATFGGASTMTVATNAAGQAAVSSLSPAASGAFQINVSAAFQGQVATATIAQTNVMTAAQAAAAAGANSAGASAGSTGGASGGAGGAAGGAGGGLSTTTLVVAGAAVAGGAVAATQIADKVGGGETEFAGSFSGTIVGAFSGGINGSANCNYTRSVGATARLRFTASSDSSLTGRFEYSGTENSTTSNCPQGTPQAPQFIGQVDLSGSPSHFSGRNVFPAPSTVVNGATISGEHVYTFEGSVSGDTATGTFTFVETSLSVGSGGNEVRQSGNGSFTITFQKTKE
jgi:hypothetical protein